MLKTPIADINNMGGKVAGAITAGLFLREFVPEGAAWAHLDIAATATYKDGPEDPRKHYLTKGGSGVPARMLVQLLRNWE